MYLIANLRNEKKMPSNKKTQHVSEYHVKLGGRGADILHKLFQIGKFSFEIFQRKVKCEGERAFYKPKGVLM